jgi:hypothetical protein
VSGDSGLSVNLALLDAVTDYLASADAINALADGRLWLTSTLGTSNYGTGRYGEALKQVKSRSKEIFQILDRLDALLKRELEVNSKSNGQEILK